MRISDWSSDVCSSDLAPISSKNIPKFTFKNATRLVLDTFHKFDPSFALYTERLFKENHIDSEIRNGKTGGAFCYTVAPKRTPYVLLNFNGMMRDVSTMAHELDRKSTRLNSSH